MRLHAKLTEENGELVAYILTPDNQDVENPVLVTHLSIVPANPQVAFYGIPHERAVYYSNAGILKTLEAIAIASSGIAQETEQWYELSLKLTGEAILKQNKVITLIGGLLLLGSIALILIAAAGQ